MSSRRYKLLEQYPDLDLTRWWYERAFIGYYPSWLVGVESTVTMFRSMSKSMPRSTA